MHLLLTTCITTSCSNKALFLSPFGEVHREFITQDNSMCCLVVALICPHSFMCIAEITRLSFLVVLMWMSPSQHYTRMYIAWCTSVYIDMLHMLCSMLCLHVHVSSVLFILCLWKCFQSFLSLFPNCSLIQLLHQLLQTVGKSDDRKVEVH